MPHHPLGLLPCADLGRDFFSHIKPVTGFRTARHLAPICHTEEVPNAAGLAHCLDGGPATDHVSF